MSRQYWYSTPSSCNSLGSVSAIAFGGTPPYTYTWVSTGNDFNVLAAPNPLVVYDEDINNVSLHIVYWVFLIGKGV